MPRGGRRFGAGRKPGSKTRRTREEQALIDRLRAGGLQPLEIMLFVMRDHFAAGRYDMAAEVAALAAPYVHPKLSAIQATVTVGDISRLTDDDLLRIAASAAGNGSPGAA